MALRLALLLMVIFFVPAASAAPVTLPELEARLSNGVEVLKASEELAAASLALEALRERSGLSFFADLSARGINEPLSRSESSSVEGYSSYSFRLGARLPLFGSWHKERIAQLEARLGELEAQRRLYFVKRTNLTALRKAWASLWTARRRMEALNAFLALEGRFMPVMERRSSQGFLLRSDLMEMKSWFLLARREAAASRALEEAALNVIRRACGIPSLPMELDPGVPPLKPVSLSYDEALRIARHLSGELKAMSDAAEVRRFLATHRARGQYDSYLQGGFQVTRESPGRYGEEAFLSLSFTFPEGEPRAASLDASAEIRRLRALEADMSAHRMSLESSLAEGSSRFRYALAQGEFSLARLKSALEALRTANLRHGAIPGDTAEKLLRAHLDVMNSALALIDAEGAAAQYHAELLEVLEDPGAPSPSPGQVWAVTPTDFHQEGAHLISLWLASSLGPKSSPAASPKGEGAADDAVPVGAYMWDGDRLLKGDLNPLDQAKALGISALRVSFTSGGVLQIIKKGEPRDNLLKALDRASKMGIRMELCLGDPWWITSEGRPHLVSLVSSLGDLPFEGLNLDLEPDQLEGVHDGSRMAYLQNTLESVKAASKASPWGVSLSMHPRYLEGQFLHKTLSGLSGSGVREVTCMVYVSNPMSAADRINRIASAAGVNISLAVSVERGGPKEESFYYLGRAEFFSKVLPYLKGRLVGPGSAIWIQSLEDLLSMPEGGSGR
ncbi:MAG: TolC family protein [Thermanaerothrix sp.]|nr:TolC family protein [Thermanaerothrix sp.]